MIAPPAGYVLEDDPPPPGYVLESPVAPAAPRPVAAPSVADQARVRLASRGTTPDEVKRQAAAGNNVDPQAATAVEERKSDIASVGSGAAGLLGGFVSGIPEQLWNIATFLPKAMTRANIAILNGGGFNEIVDEVNKDKPHREWENGAAAAAADAHKTFRQWLGIRPTAIIPQEDLVQQLPGLVAMLAMAKTGKAGEAGAAEAKGAPGEIPPAAEIDPLHVDAAMPKPDLGAALDLAKKAAPIKEMVDAVAPASASPEAGLTADVLRRSKSEIANDATIERVRNHDVAKSFSKVADAENVDSISNFELTGRFKAGKAFPDQAAADAYSKMYQESTDAAHETLKQVYGDDRVGYVENYIRRAFKFGTEKDAAKATGVLSNYVGSLSASKAALRGRVLDMPLDEALQTMRDNGIDVKPVTTNPELLRQWTVENANQARVYKQAWAYAKSGKLIEFVRQGQRIGKGLVKLDDRVAKVFRPTEEGPVQTGQYYAEPGVARIFNNAISQGLGGSPTFRSIRTINNAYNQMQLGFSGFHLTGTAINAGISDMSLGIQQLLQGDVAAGSKSIGRSAVPGFSFARNLYKGRAFINDLVADDPVARQFLEEKLNPAGGRLGVDAAYRNKNYENMVNAWANKRYVRALGNSVLAVPQIVAAPLMEYAIPRVKLGAFMDLAEAQRAKLGAGATDTQIARGYQQAWDSIDNRFGQLTHDNLFWNRTAADLAQVSTRSVGWNLGTIRELGGGAADIVRGNANTPRALYAFALPMYAGTIGAIYHYLHTGKAPTETKDYFYPKNGLTDAKGREDRITLPTYMKDVYAYSDHPVTTLEHKASPLLSLAFDLGTNRDYFGDMIRNPDAPVSKQWLQNGTYALKQFRPFTVQQAQDSKGAPAWRTAEQFGGFVNAPAEMKQPPGQAAGMKERRRLKNEAMMEKARRKHGGT